MERIARCPGSVAQTQEIVDIRVGDTSHADRGRDLHLEISRVVERIVHAYRVWPPTSAERAWGVPRDMSVSSEVADAIRLLGEHIDMTPWLSIMATVEVELALDPVCDGITGGTADMVCAVPFDHAMVVDWKFGRQPVPAAGENLQLAAYAVSVSRRTMARDVTVVIVQPALSWVSIVHMDHDALSRAADRVSAVVGAARQPWAPLRTGGHCRWCPAMSTCPAVLGQVAEAHGTGCTSETLDRAEMVRAWAGEIQASAMSQIMAGGTIDGWVVSATERRVWLDGVTAETLSADLAAAGREIHPSSLVTVPEVKSPAQVEKLVGRSKPVRDVISSLTEKKVSHRLTRRK